MLRRVEEHWELYYGMAWKRLLYAAVHWIFYVHNPQTDRIRQIDRPESRPSHLVGLVLLRAFLPASTKFDWPQILVWHPRSWSMTCLNYQNLPRFLPQVPFWVRHQVF